MSLYILPKNHLNEYILLNLQLMNFITAVGDFALFCLFIGVSKFILNKIKWKILALILILD